MNIIRNVLFIIIGLVTIETTSGDTSNIKSSCPENTILVEGDECSEWGCRIRPLDWTSPVTRDILRELKLGGEKESKTATLTMKGYKGPSNPYGDANQDQSILVSPYISPTSMVQENNGERCISTQEPNLLLGVFDGHGFKGEVVSEYAAQQLPELLYRKLSSFTSLTDDTIKQALIQSFLEIDATIPTNREGGCTASVVLQLGPKLYFANAGDSQSFLVAFNPTSLQTQILYKTRMDLPELPDEKRRIEESGGSVYFPSNPNFVPRVKLKGVQGGLAMSRAIGDWDFGKAVTAEPIVDVLSIPELLDELSTTCSNPKDNIASSDPYCQEAEQSFHIFAVSASDGLLDFLESQKIAEHLAKSLYLNSKHLLSACEDLIKHASNAWSRERNNQYRDDIIIAVSDIIIP